MQFSKLATTAAVLVGLVAASPVEKRDFDAQLTLFKVNGGTYHVAAPADTKRAGPVILDYPEDIAVVGSEGGATCQIKGTKGFEGTINGARSIQVLPAQPIKSVYCTQF
ncbi:hypothetical protein F5B20DRAFT_550158 [Whalleya microplaca]|nr:hypothetical protein F5B20DRAFT_550158 [Whalleya microplaca]